MADHITLTGLTVRGHHGVFDYEKRDGQDFVVDVTVWLDLSSAAAHDDLALTVNYAALAATCREVIAGPARDLIETVAAEIADRIVAGFPIERVQVTLHKPHAPIPEQFADVAVTVDRQAETAQSGSSVRAESPGQAENPAQAEAAAQ